MYILSLVYISMDVSAVVPIVWSSRSISLRKEGRKEKEKKKFQYVTYQLSALIIILFTKLIICFQLLRYGA